MKKIPKRIWESYLYINKSYPSNLKRHKQWNRPMKAGKKKEGAGIIPFP